MESDLIYTDGLLWWSGESDRVPVRAYRVRQTEPNVWVVTPVDIK
jgi:hypothetical protein